MRFNSELQGGYRVYAVAGTNTVSFAIDFSAADTTGLLGFAVERRDIEANKRFYLYGFKVFKSIYPEPHGDLTVSTYDHPIQSFVYDDFTVKPGHAYEYYFHPLKGAPAAPDRSAPPVSLEVRAEPLYSELEHDVFFNRGVTSSQAYSRKFGNQSPAQLEAAGKHDLAQQALDWLSRDLDDAMLKFISDAEAGDTLLGCFYEFNYAAVLRALRQAQQRGVVVRLIVDAKENADGAPRTANLAAIEEAGLSGDGIILRTARVSAIQHNKFMVLLQGAALSPVAVWTGSTNVSNSGIHGQANVGHWVRNAEITERFAAYWQLLSGDPGGKKGETRGEVLEHNAALRNGVEELGGTPLAWRDYPSGITPIFSPRSGLGILKMYASLLDDASELACITLAFGVNQEFKTLLKDNTADSALTFLLLEKEDKPNPDKPDAYIALSAANNTYTAFGATLRDPLYQWVRETTNKELGLGTHINYIHSKFLLKDPLGDDPVVVTGSANFSDPSTKENDENMLFIRGNLRVADIYFTEFNRLFNHYYFRAVQQRLKGHETPEATEASLFLTEDDGWLGKYQPGSLRRKRVEVFVRMALG